MPSDVRLTHSHRLPPPSHSISPYNSANLPSQPFTVNAASGPSSHRISRVALDGFGDAQSSGHTSTYARGRSDAFPSTFADQGILARQRRDALERAVEARGAGPSGSSRSNTWGGDDAWSWDDEHIYIRPSLLPLPSSQFGGADDPLPSEQHPSYPLGRPIDPRPTSIHPRASLSHHVQTSRAFLTEAAAWNSGTGQGVEGGQAAATGVQSASVPNATGAEAATAAEAGSEALWKPLTGVPPYLASLKAAAVAASTTTQQGGRAAGAGGSSQRQAHAAGCWPFVNFGPGTSLVRRRDEDDWDDANAGPGTAAAAAREVWLEHDFEKLLPMGRERDPLEYLNAGLLRQAPPAAGAQPSSEAAATNTAATDEASSYLDRVETEMAQRVASQLKVAAGAEVHKEESDASQQLRALLAAGSTPSLPALAPPPAVETARSSRPYEHQQQQQQQHQQQKRPLPTLLLDRFGGDAEELRALLTASTSSVVPPKRNESGGWDWSDMISASIRAEHGRSAESEWLRRARRAREEEERARLEGLAMGQAATAT